MIITRHFYSLILILSFTGCAHASSNDVSAKEKLLNYPVQSQSFFKKVLLDQDTSLVAVGTEASLKERERKADSGSALSQLNLGLDHKNGTFGLADHQRAVFWFTKSAEQGNAVAQLILGDQYSLGEGVPSNQVKAFEWYLKAAEKGVDAAQHKVGMRYVEGNGVTKDDRQAFIWFAKAAEQGFDLSQVQLGLSYMLGRGVAKNFQSGILWIRKSAEQGSAEGQIGLGMAYSLGEGVPRDDQEAMIWFKKAAIQGSAHAQLRLGVIYGTGLGVPKDVQQAYFWFLLSAARGDAKAAQIRDSLENQLSTDQRNAVQVAAREWKPQFASKSKQSSVGEHIGESRTASPLSAKETLPDSTGSGFRVARGIFVTNHHVSNGCSRLRVNGVFAQLRGSDARSDLSLISSELVGPSVVLRSRRNSVGEPVAVAGFPLQGLLSGFNMTTGSISSMSGIGNDTRLIQITAPVQQGNSGGPALDSAGNLIGVVVSKLDALKTVKMTGDIPQNVNFAINVNVLRAFLDANSVDYETASADRGILPTAIAEKAKKVAVLIECWR